MPPTVGHVRKRDDDTISSCTSSALDSMRPGAQPRKRRRTILDAFQSISLFKGNNDNEDDCDDADSSQAVAAGGEGEDSYSTSSSLEDEEDSRLLSDREEAERKVMFELVFGTPTEVEGGGTATSTNPVDAALQGLIRKSLHQVNDLDRATGDDMTIDAVYSRTSLGAVTPAGEQPAAFSLPRSNSLPNIFSAANSTSAASESMNTSSS